MISQHLKSFACFVPCERGFLDGKKPILRSKENDWNDHLVDYEAACSCIHNGQNVGLCAGHGLVILDCDSPELLQAAQEMLPPTYTEVTPSNGWHLVFKFEGQIENKNFNQGSKHLGELRAYREYVIIAPSMAVSKIDSKLKPYVVVNDVPPALLTVGLISAFIKRWDGKSSPIVASAPHITTGGGESEASKTGDRSRYDYAKCCELIENGYSSFGDVCDKMREYGSTKWHSRGLSYQRLTYLAAWRRVGGKVRV